MAKGKGWDNDVHRQASKKLGEDYRQHDNVKQFERAKNKYDPTKEVVVAKIGSIAIRESGPHLHVEIAQYDNKYDGIMLSQQHADHTKRFYKLRSGQADELAALLTKAVQVLKEREAASRAKYEAEREAARQERQDADRHETVRKIIGNR
jgi:hypothetical protein